jgi:hypothetical protein
MVSEDRRQSGGMTHNISSFYVILRSATPQNAPFGCNPVEAVAMMQIDVREPTEYVGEKPTITSWKNGQPMATNGVVLCEFHPTGEYFGLVSSDFSAGQ